MGNRSEKRAKEHRSREAAAARPTAGSMPTQEMDDTFNWTKPKQGGGATANQPPNDSDQREHGPPPRRHSDIAKEQGRRGQGYTPAEQVKRLARMGNRLMMIKEHSYVLSTQKIFDECLKPANANKNRFANLILYDETRLILDDEFAKERGDYIHASYVDGFDRKCQYILCQAPFTADTESDFWRMVWQERPSCIVLVTPLISSKNDMLARNFWPNAKKDKSYLNGQIRVITESVRFGNDCDFYDLCVSRATERHTFGLPLMHYRQWEKDEQVPATLLAFVGKARHIARRQEKELAKTDGTEPGNEAPTLVVCCTGAHRSGTFVALDILLRRMQERRRVAIDETVTQMRRERFGCVHLEKHYAYLTEALVNYAIQTGIVHTEQLPPASNFVAGVFTLG